MKPTEWIRENAAPALLREWERLEAQRKDLDAVCQEIRLRSPGRCSLVMEGENFPLFSSVSRADLAELMRRLTHGTEYAYADTLTAGYLPCPDGIRVGVCGEAKYENGRILGIGNVSAMNIRFPHPAPDCPELAETFRREVGSGLLIFSPPGEGKTTVLRGLVRALGSGSRPLRVCAVDERMEFIPEEVASATVELLRGYRKSVGIALATRTLSPQVIAVDEIGGEAEALAMRDCLHAGIPLIATAHAGSPEELCRKSSLRPFAEGGIFDRAVSLRRAAGRTDYRVYAPDGGAWKEVGCGVIRDKSLCPA